MSAAEESRMRKRACGSDDHVLTGAFTRRKSEVFVHRTRSGRCRHDWNRHPSDLTGSQLPTKRPRATASTRDQQFSDEASFPPFLVKDLRARRVTSASVNEEDDGVARKVKESAKADSLICSCLEDVKKLIDGFHPDKQHPDGAESREPEIAGESSDCSQIIQDKDVDKSESRLVSKGLEALGAEDSSSPQSTPPDAEICAAKLDSEKNKEGKLEPGDQILEKTLPTNEFPRRKLCRRVLSPCSRVKLFKAPNSVSYKRMLPYLMGVAKEYSDASGKCQNQKSVESLGQCIVSRKLVEESEKDYRLTNGELSSNSQVRDEPSSMTNSDGNTIKFEDELSCQGLVESKSSQDPSLVMADCPLEKHNSAEVTCDETELQIGSQAELATPLVPNIQDSKCSLLSQECHPCADGVTRKCFDERILCQTEVTWSGLQHSLAAQHPHHIEPSSDCIEGSPDQKKRVVGNEAKVSDQVVNIEDCVQTKRPDFVWQTKEDASSGSRTLGRIHGANTATDNSTGSFQHPSACSTGAQQESCTVRKQVLKSGRRKRLFQIPGSLNYRRMFHVLRAAGLSEDGQFEVVRMSNNGKSSSPSSNHTGSGNIGSADRMMVDQGPSQMIDSEKPQPSSCHIDSNNTSLKSLETIDQGPTQISDTDRPPSPLDLHADSSKMNPVCEETIDQDPTQKSGTEKPPSPLGHQVGSKNVIQVGLETINHGLHCNKQLPPSQNISNLHMDLDSKQTQESAPETIDSNKPGTTREDGAGTVFQAQPTCLIKTVPSDTEITAALQRKGILRQNPRGCRGLCTCLNCSSFRLHAERAFVFSRNQMLDAEEVALDLMRELAHMRSMLQKSSVGTAGQAVICLNQVKEACMKCSEAENVAKHRLSQMNNELRIHCRVPYEHGARVRFANDVQLVTPSAHLQTTG